MANQITSDDLLAIAGRRSLRSPAFLASPSPTANVNPPPDPDPDPEPPPGIPGTVQNIQAVAITSSRIDVSWDHLIPQPNNYKVYRDGILIATLSGGVNTYNNVGLQPNTTYGYYITGLNGILESTAPEEGEVGASATTLAFSGTPIPGTIYNGNVLRKVQPRNLDPMIWGADAHLEVYLEENHNFLVTDNGDHIVEANASGEVVITGHYPPWKTTLLPKAPRVVSTTGAISYPGNPNPPSRSIGNPHTISINGGEVDPQYGKTKQSIYAGLPQWFSETNRHKPGTSPPLTAHQSFIHAECYEWLGSTGLKFDSGTAEDSPHGEKRIQSTHHMPVLGDAETGFYRWSMLRPVYRSTHAIYVVPHGQLPDEECFRPGAYKKWDSTIPRTLYKKSRWNPGFFYNCQTPTSPSMPEWENINNDLYQTMLAGLGARQANGTPTRDMQQFIHVSPFQDGSARAPKFGTAWLKCCMAYPDGEKKRTLELLTQIGIDLFSIIESADTSRPEMWGRFNGQLGQFYTINIILAGLMLGEQKMIDVNKNYGNYVCQEMTQTAILGTNANRARGYDGNPFLAGSTLNTARYRWPTSGAPGPKLHHVVWTENAAEFPWNNTSQPALFGGYQEKNVTPWWYSIPMILYTLNYFNPGLQDMRLAFDHEEFFDYVDDYEFRYKLALPNASAFPMTPTPTYTSGGTFPGAYSQSAIFTNYWQLYRTTYGDAVGHPVKTQEPY